MGLLDKLQTQGSNLSVNNGQQLNSPNQLNTVMSPLHATNQGNAGYSLTGVNSVYVGNQYAAYNDGITNALPAPSQLDTNGSIPSTSGHNNNAPGASTQNLPYLQNLPT